MMQFTASLAPEQMADAAKGNGKICAKFEMLKINLKW